MKAIAGKLTLFSLIITGILFGTSIFTSMEIFGLLALLMLIVTIGLVVIWLSSLIAGRIRYSGNVITCFGLLVLVAVIWLFFLDEVPTSLTVDTIMNLSYAQTAFVASVLAFVLSLIIYIGRLMFGSKEQPEAQPVQTAAPEPQTVKPDDTPTGTDQQ